ncbi:MAG: methylmalonyl Co-A mutase-associated GTPase MeaB [Planctomycetota bacterium]|jgi:LAO/AO transport system ATPase
MSELADKIHRGDRHSLARAMSLVGQSAPAGRELEDTLRRSTGQVPWWGVTGPPGVGKSTLIDALLGMLRERGRRVGVVAIDPTSPLSNGALLGDRVRMMRHAADEDVFIRSLATRGREGGLSDAAVHCARLLELANFDPVMIETVGVGQNEVDIAWVADICVVVLGPGYGDSIQLIKAGLLEIPDIVVVNKCDLPGANRLLEEVNAELGMTSPAKDVDIISVEAKSGKGVDTLLDKLLELDGVARGAERRQLHRHRRILGEIKRSAMLTYERALECKLAGREAEDLVTKLEQGELTLDSVVALLGSAALAEQQQAGDGID